MDNQHKKITGYRELSQVEIDLMNQIKNVGNILGNQVNVVLAGLNEELESINLAAQLSGGIESPELVARYTSFYEAHEWAQLAKKNLQTGLMQLTRSVARPESF